MCVCQESHMLKDGLGRKVHRILGLHTNCAFIACWLGILENDDSGGTMCVR